MPTIKSTPYRWPWNGLFDIRNFALIVTSAMFSNQDYRRITQQYRSRLRHFADTVQQAGGLVVEVACSDPRITNSSRRIHDNSASVLSSGDRFTDTDLHFQSAGIDAFYSSPLEDILNRNHRRLVGLCGTWFETSVHSTMREANDRGIECVAFHDISLCLDPQHKENTISQIEMSGGIFGAVSTSEDFATAFCRY